MDGKIDGQFVRTQNNDLIKDLSNELGLTETQRNKLGSIWNDVIQEVNNPENYQIFNIHGDIEPELKLEDSQNTFGKIIKLTKECLNNIINKINMALGTNIESEENDEKQTNKNIGEALIQEFKKQNPNAVSSTYAAQQRDYFKSIGDIKKSKEWARVAIKNEKSKNDINCRARAEELNKYYNSPDSSEIIDMVDPTMNDEGYFNHGTHSFFVIGLNKDENYDPTNPSTWGENAIIVDAWAGKTFTVEEGMDYYKRTFFYDDKSFKNDMKMGRQEDINKLWE